MTSSYFGLETEENKLINSNNLSFAASLGIHALILAIILPNFLNNPAQEPKKELRNVNLIELNPLEQSRLPSLDSSLSSLPGLPNLNSSSSSLPPLPAMDGIHNSTLPPLPSVSSLPPLPPLSSLPSVNIYSPPVASISSSGRLPIPRNFPTSTPSLPSPPSVPTLSENNNRPRGTNNQQLQPYFDPYRDNLTPDELRNSPRSASQQAQERIVGERFPEYWDARNIHLARVTYLPIPDNTVRLANLQSGAVEFAERMEPDDMKPIQRNRNLRAVAVDELGYQSISINTGNGERANTPFGRDARIRRAFELAIDRAAVNQVVYEGMYVPTRQPFPPASPFHVRDFPPTARDLARAQALLREAGATLPITPPNSAPP